MTANSADCRNNAAECYRLAERLADPEHRRLAIELAKAWTQLAEWLESHDKAEQSFKSTRNPDGANKE